MNRNGGTAPLRMTVAYPAREGARFDLDYYREQHMPMVSELLAPALTGYEVWLGNELLGGGVAPWHVLLHMELADRETFDAAFAAHGERIVADIPNYTDIEPLVQMDDRGFAWKEKH